MTVKRIIVCCLCVLIGAFLISHVAFADTFYVYSLDSSGDIVSELGTIDNYTGTESGIVNYNRLGSPLSGPQSELKTSKLYMYQGFNYSGATQLSLGILHGKVEGDDPTSVNVHFDYLTHNTSGDYVLLSDDGGELVKSATTSTVYNGTWTFLAKLSDGGVIGPIAPGTEPPLGTEPSGTWWIDVLPVKIDPYIVSWDIYSSLGDVINLGNPNLGYGPIRIASASLTEPIPIGSSALLLITGVLGVVGLKRRKVV